VAAAAIGQLSSLGLTDFRLPLDVSLFRWLNDLSSATLDWLAIWLSRPVFDWTCAVVGFLVLGFKLRRRALGFVICALAAAGVTDLLGARVVKPWIHRMRPFDALPPGTVHQLFAVSHRGSMPSLHAANAFALACVLTWASRPLGAVAYVLAVLIALSRVVGGVHWPSDIIVGAGLGTTVGLAAIWTARRLTAARAGDRTP
jgi:undecaprenyl-diphosphatase